MTIRWPKDRLVAKILQSTNGGAVSVDLIAAVIWRKLPPAWMKSLWVIISRLRAAGMRIVKDNWRGYVTYRLESHW